MDQIQEVMDEKQQMVDSLELLLMEERKRYLYEALSQLSVSKREVLLMQYFSRLSQKEIAAILQVTPENVRVLSYRAKKELKLYLEGNGYDLS